MVFIVFRSEFFFFKPTRGTGNPSMLACVAKVSDCWSLKT